METFAPIFVAVAMCLVAFCFSSHWQMLLADFRFLQAWHGQLQVSRGTDCPLAAAKKRRVSAALEDVRQKNFVLTARILTHFTALKALTLTYEFCQEPRVGALAHLAILAVGYAQHSVVGHGKFRPTPQQVRWLSSSIYLQFLATVSVHALTEPSESSGVSTCRSGGSRVGMSPACGCPSDLGPTCCNSSSHWAMLQSIPCSCGLITSFLTCWLDLVGKSHCRLAGPVPCKSPQHQMNCWIWLALSEHSLLAVTKRVLMFCLTV